MDLESDWARVLAQGPVSELGSDSVVAALVSDYRSELVLVRGSASDYQSVWGSGMGLVSALQSE